MQKNDPTRLGIEAYLVGCKLGGRSDVKFSIVGEPNSGEQWMIFEMTSQLTKLEHQHYSVGAKETSTFLIVISAIQSA